MKRKKNFTTADLPIRTCFMIDNLGRAGVETQLIKIINQLDRAVVDPHLCVLSPRTDYAASFVPNDCPVYWLELTTMRRPSALAHALKFRRYLRDQQIDVLHLDLPGSTLFGIPVGWLSGVPYIIRTRRDMGYWMGRIDRITGRLYSQLVDMTITNCQACKQSIIEVEGAKPETIAILKNDINLSQYQHIPAFAEGNCSTDKRTVGMVANLRPEKSPDVFISAARLVVEKHPNVNFCIAGEGELRGKLEQQITASGLTGVVQLPGRETNVPRFLSQLDIAVLSSNTEGMPNVLVEYMAAGRPVVATRVGGAEELIDHEVHGLIVEPRDVESLANAICRLLDDNSLAEYCAANGRARVQNEYGGPNIAQRFEQLLLPMMSLSNLGGQRPEAKLEPCDVV